MAETRIRASARLPIGLHRAALLRAAADRISLNTLICRAIAEYLR
jgi:predicted HicB family RNase H-like nuclease